MSNKLKCFSCAFRDNVTANAWKRDRCVVYNGGKPIKISSGKKECACYAKDNGENRN